MIQLYYSIRLLYYMIIMIILSCMYIIYTICTSKAILAIQSSNLLSNNNITETSRALARGQCFYMHVHAIELEAAIILYETYLKECIPSYAEK